MIQRERILKLVVDNTRKREKIVSQYNYVDVLAMDDDRLNDEFKYFSVRPKAWEIFPDINEAEDKGLINKKEKAWLFVVAMLAQSQGEEELFEKIKKYIAIKDFSEGVEKFLSELAK